MAVRRDVVRARWFATTLWTTLLFFAGFAQATAALPVSRMLRSPRQSATARLAVSENDFIWPASGTITQNAAEHHDSEGLYAEDIENSEGTPVVAAFDGTVTYAGTTGDAYYCSEIDQTVDGDGFGNFVVIRHDGGSSTYYTMYAHLSSWRVRAGQVVAQGTTIGKMGDTGCSTGTHTHFQIGTCTNGVYIASNCTIWWAPDPADGTRVTGGTLTGGHFERPLWRPGTVA